MYISVSLNSHWPPYQLCLCITALNILEHSKSKSTDLRPLSSSLPPLKQRPTSTACLDFLETWWELASHAYTLPQHSSVATLKPWKISQPLTFSRPLFWGILLPLNVDVLSRATFMARQLGRATRTQKNSDGSQFTSGSLFVRMSPWTRTCIISTSPSDCCVSISAWTRTRVTHILPTGSLCECLHMDQGLCHPHTTIGFCECLTMNQDVSPPHCHQALWVPYHGPGCVSLLHHHQALSSFEWLLAELISTWREPSSESFVSQDSFFLMCPALFSTDILRESS